MGRLFWKFFAFIWLAQFAGIVAIGTAFWLTEPHFDPAFGALDPGAALGRIDTAAAVLRYGGAVGARSWLEHEPVPVVFIVDDSGHDLLDRAVAPAALEHAREELRTERRPAASREVSAADGRHFVIYSAAGEPFGPPGSGPGPPRRGRPPLTSTFGTLLASLVTALVLAWYVAKPVRSLRAAFDALAGGNLDTRVAPLIGDRHDELADLGRDFDRMAGRLQTSMNGQRRLLHDVSHEMRSPLARLQAAIGLIRLKYGREEPIERIEEEIVRMDKMVGDLLKLSRLEAGELAGAEEDIDMRELVREVVSDANFEAQASGREVTWERETTGTVAGRPEMLHGAIENVLRNALKHAPDSREVGVETFIDNARALYTLRVIDSGPGVPDDELAVLFTPFFRAVDAARTDGYGLGLAIARRSIEAHGGTIGARNRPGGGLVVEIALPLKTAGSGPAVAAGFT